MAKKYDFEGLAKTLLADILGNLHNWLPNGKREGTEYVATNPTRNDSKPGSFKVNLRNGKWADFAANAKGGDLISLYAYLKGLDNAEAYKELTGERDKDFVPHKRDQQTKASTVPPEEIFEPREIPEGREMPAVKGKPEVQAVYRFADGRPAFRVVIFRDKKTGRKTPVPCAYGFLIRPKIEVLEDGTEKWNGTDMIQSVDWHKKHWPSHRVPYNLDKITRFPNLPVLVQEGEAKTQYVEKVLGDAFVCTCWAGGANAYEKTDWTGIQNRKVIISPDYDLPGQSAALAIAAKLARQGCDVYLIWEPLDENRHPEGWDLKEEKNHDTIRQMVAGALPLKVVQNIVAEEKREDVKAGDMSSSHSRAGDSIPAEVLQNQRDLRCLGYGPDNRCYFINRRRGVVVPLGPEQLGNLSHLLSLAELPFWYDLFPDKKGGVDKHVCCDTLQRWADSVGFFTADKVRGAGVWMDNDKDIVLHMGQELLVNNKVIPLHEYDSEYMYEATNDLGLQHVKPLATSEAKRLLQFTNKFDWDCPVYPYLLAGFCVVAPLCGGLRWRPHIWITGESGSGKSTVMSHIVRRMCGKVCLHVQGETTSSGIRQRLGSDALPVIFDEFEGESQNRQMEQQKILDLARQASDESGAALLKGSMGGESMEFRVRSCFAFSAINVNMTQQADKNRITVLTLRSQPKGLDAVNKEKRFDSFQNFVAELDAVLTDDFVNAMIMRSFAMLPVIRENAKVFKKAVTAKLNEPRLGDQLGTLCAGAYSLENTGVVTYDDAMKWVEMQDWTRAAPSDEHKDHERCFGYIMQHKVRMVSNGNNQEFSIGELVATAMKEQPQLDGSLGDRERVLRGYGIRLDRERKVIMIANSDAELEKVMRGTPYMTWSRLLLRLDGARPSDKTMRFTPGSPAVRAVEIPFEMLTMEPGQVRAIAF